MDFETRKLMDEVKDNAFSIAKILKKKKTVEITKAVNGLKITEIKKTTVRK